MKDLKSKTENELVKLLTDKETALNAFRFGSNHSKKRNVKEGRELKKDIARILTEMSFRNSSAH